LFYTFLVSSFSDYVFFFKVENLNYMEIVFNFVTTVLFYVGVFLISTCSSFNQDVTANVYKLK